MLGGGFGCFFLLHAAWVRSRAERPSVSEASEQLHVHVRMQIKQTD